MYILQLDFHGENLEYYIIKACEVYIGSKLYSDPALVSFLLQLPSDIIILPVKFTGNRYKPFYIDLIKNRDTTDHLKKSNVISSNILLPENAINFRRKNISSKSNGNLFCEKK